MKISASCMDEGTETIFIALESGGIMYFIDLGMVAGSFYHVRQKIWSNQTRFETRR